MKKLFTVSILLLGLRLFSQNKEDNAKFVSNSLVHQGAIEASKGNFMKAISHYNDAIEFYPKNSLAYYDRAVAKYNLQDYRGAYSDCDKALTYNEGANETNADTYYIAGLCAYFLKDLEQACKCFSKGGELGNEECYKIIREKCR